MGLQRISDRRRRALAERLGLPIDRLAVADNHTWLACVPLKAGHIHLRLNPRTLDVGDDLGPCWSTCDTPRYGSVLSPYAWTTPGSRSDVPA